jgi:lysozyme
MDDLDFEKLLAQLIRLEGRWLAPYYDGAGNLIVVAAHREEQALTDPESMTVLESDVRRVALHLEDKLPVVGRLDAVRQRVLFHMAFNMGVEQLLTLPRFISAVQFRNWEAAAEEMLISDWAKHEQRRANVLAQLMRTGRDDLGSVSERRSGNKPRR